jgi:hypothetical protein
MHMLDVLKYAEGLKKGLNLFEMSRLEIRWIYGMGYFWMQIN